MNLEVGMYVRTENGIIEKVNRIYDRHTTDNIVVWLNGYGDGRSVFIDDFEEVKYQSINARGFIKKEPSFNIIDLIEVGDYVNGYRVDYIENINANNIFILQRIFCEEYEKGLYAKSFSPKDIKSIVTKEQFEAMKYEL